MAEVDRTPERRRTRNDCVNIGGTDLLKTVLSIMEQIQIIQSKLDEHAERLDKGLQAMNNKVDFLTEQLNQLIAERSKTQGIFIRGEVDPEQRYNHLDPRLENTVGDFLDLPKEYRSRQSSDDSGFVFASSRTKERTKSHTVSNNAVQMLEENHSENSNTCDSGKEGDTTNKIESVNGNEEDNDQMILDNSKLNGHYSLKSSFLHETSQNRYAASESMSNTGNTTDKSPKVSLRDLGTESDNNDSDSTESEFSVNSSNLTLETNNHKPNKARVKIEPVVDESDSELDDEDHEHEIHEQKDSDRNTQEIESDVELKKQLQQQIQNKHPSHQEGDEEQPKIAEYQRTEQYDQPRQHDDHNHSSKRQEDDRFTEDYQDIEQDSIDLNKSPVHGSDPRPISRKRPNSSNYGSYNINDNRSKSPEPFCSKRKIATYSCFKKIKTHNSEDNRLKYLEKVFDFHTNTGDSTVRDNVDPEPRTMTESDSLQQVSSMDWSRNIQNNQQIPVSGLKNEHGQWDNRFVEEAHTDAVPRYLQKCQFENISIIQPNPPILDMPEKVSNQNSAGDHTLNDINERKRMQQQASSTVSDKEIHLLVQNEQQEAKACKDPKSMHGIDTVICLDVSASMAGEPLEIAKQFTMNFLEGLDESAAEHSLEENVALVTFGSQNRVLQHLTNNYDLIRNSFDTLEADGPSPLWLGIALCLTELSVRGGCCTMDSLKVLPRIIIISDFMSSVKNRLVGPDIQDIDQKGNFEVSGIVDKNRTSVSSFDFVVVGQNVNQGLLESIAQNRQFTVDDVLYLSQFFRAQDTVNIVLSEMVEDEINEDFVKNLMRNRGMTERSERDIMNMIKDKTAARKEFKDRERCRSPMSLESEQVPNNHSEEPDKQLSVNSSDDFEEPAFGSHVRANPEWVGYHTRKNLLGTVIAPRKQGCLKILWEDGTQERLKYGVNGEYCVILDDVIDEVMKDGIRVGTVVERGRDWRWGEQDGGQGNPGVVCSYDEKKKVVNVLWEKGGQGNYRFGYKSCFDVAIRSELQKKRDETEKHPYWQMQLEADNWLFFAPEVNKTIETRYNLKDRSTFLVNNEDVSYRISFNSMNARSTLTSVNHPIQRLELTKAERRSMSNET